MIAAVTVVSALSAVSLPVSEQAQAEYQQEIAYPTTRSGDWSDTYHGSIVHDPYRWLEEESPEVDEWAAAQDSLTRRLLRAWDGYDTLHGRVGQLVSVPDQSVPIVRGARSFYIRSDPETGLQSLYLNTGEDETVLLDAGAMRAEGTLGNFAPSPDGQLVLYAIGDGAARWQLLVRHVETLRDMVIGLPIRARSFNTRSWLPDGSGFFVTLDREGDLDPVVLVRIHSDHYSVAWSFNGQEVGASRLTPRVDDRYPLLALEGQTSNGREVYLFSLDDLSSGYRTIRGDPGSRQQFVGAIDPETVAIRTNHRAPNGRIVEVSLDSTEPEAWRPLIDESRATLDDAFLYGNKLLAYYIKDARPHLELFDFQGELLHEIVPPFGLIWTDFLAGWPGFAGHASDRFAYLRSLNLAAPGIYRVDLERGEIEPHFLRERSGDSEFFLEHSFFESEDGTTIPIFLIGKKSVQPMLPAPTLVYAYGAYGFTPIPFFNAKYRTFMERGGLFAIPYLRGGGVYGESWHRAGTKANKVNTVADLIGATEWLIDNGYAEPGKIAVEGQGPAGAALSGAMVQRPDLFRAVVYELAVADLLRDEARWRVEELGSPDDPEEFEVLSSLSLYHNVSSNVNYPAMIVVVHERDRTVAPFHGFKLAAALQASDTPHPVLLRVDWEEGHGFFTASDRRAAEWTDELAFVLWQLGMNGE